MLQTLKRFSLFNGPLWIAAALLAALVLAPAPISAQDDAEPEIVSRWDGESRFTVLFMGMDRRPGARDNLNARTDALILMSFNPAEDSIGMLHIPRDLFFAALDVEPLLQVNTLMIRGEAIQEGYGPYFAMDTIQYNLGMYIDAFVAFDFEAFIALVDALGGVEITTEYIIDDPTYPDMNYGFDPFYLSSGTHLLDGRTALKFARTRHGDNDYLRGERQMQVIRAIGEKATDPSMLPRLITQAPQLLNTVEGNLYTDLTLAELVPLAQFAARIPLENVVTGSINQQWLDRTINTDGRAVAIPDRERLVDLMTQIFGPGYSG